MPDPNGLSHEGSFLANRTAKHHHPRHLTLLVLGRFSTGLLSASLPLLPLLRVLLFVYHTRFLLTNNSAALTQIRFYSLHLLGSLLRASPASLSRSLGSGCTGLLVHCGPPPSPHSLHSCHSWRPPSVISAVRLVGLSHKTVSFMRTWMLISLDPHVPQSLVQSQHVAGPQNTVLRT